jgi:hypothetical protein
MKEITRRGFFVLLTGGATALVAKCGRRASTIAVELRGVLGHDAHTEMIGRHYLRKVPEEANSDLLGELILSDLSWNPSFGTDIRTPVRERVRRDFAEDRVVRLGQWMLSQTEARLCALTALVNQTEPAGGANVSQEP